MRLSISTQVRKRDAQIPELIDHFILKLLIYCSFDGLGIDLVGLVLGVRLDLLAFREDGQHGVYHVGERLLANSLQYLDLPDDLATSLLFQ